MILAYAPRARWKQQRRAVANALAVFESEEVAALFVKWLPKKDVRVIATKCFARFPNIGDKALRAGSGRFAKKILEQRERASDSTLGSRREASIEKWRRIFDDYKILQPFDQLSVSE